MTNRIATRLLRLSAAAALSVHFAGAQNLLPSAAPVAESGGAKAVAADGTRGSGGLIRLGVNDGRFRLGPGDVLDVRVFGRPELTADQARVDADGMVQLPLLEHGVKAGCLSEEEVTAEITRAYREYLKEPRVSVAVREFSGNTVDVLGAVQRPGSFQLRRKVRLRELLTLAGGPAPAAGDTVQVLHEPGRAACSPDDNATGMAMISFRSMVNGAENSNPFILPGDLVQIVEARQAYVVGNVYKPSPILLNEPITMTRAIAMSGGKLPGSRDDVRLIRKREEPQGQVEVRLLRLGDIDRNKMEDPVLRAGDVVEVRTSLTKTVLKTLLQAGSSASVYYPMVILSNYLQQQNQPQPPIY